MDALDHVLSGEEKEAITKKVWSLVDALPQRDLIALSDARQWVDTVVNLHGEQAVWHAIRLNGFGGSEIGVLVRNHHGVRADHMANAHDIVLGKLMRRAPVETNEHMQRGHENEPLHASKFYKKYGAHRDQEAFDKLSKAQGSLPWMRYSPDEVALIPSRLLALTRAMADARPMSRWLADYKAPSRVEDDAEIHFQYGCQLAQGAILCDEQGIELHGLMLSQYDWAGWRLKDDVIVVNDELKDMVRLSGSWGWNCVMTGEVPPYVRTPVLADAEAFVLKHADLAVRMANASALANAADKRAQELRAELLLGLGARRLDGHKVVMPGAGTLTANFKIDVEKVQEVLTPEQMAQVVKKDGYDDKAMAAHLKSLNVDLKQFRTNKVDADKLAEHAEAFGIDLEAYVAEQPIFRVDKPIKQEMEAFIDIHYPLHVAPVVQSERESDHLADQEHQEEEETTAEAPRG
ncbi:YqaJ viral recombinase family protein [Variovorax gossypii]|uniref:YqaJ viral recombinase family protein n=1 Tax=uncultured Variovorax sp. TaxID=114708 RepID=UPI00260F802A|nr:YqaJ viral recombinase family protein [uncultured Variovorax sp.]